MKERLITLLELDKVFRKGDVYFLTLHSRGVAEKYDITVFDSDYKYYATIKDATSFDFRMLRKTYSNVYYWNEAMKELFSS